MLLACRREGTGATASPRRPHMLARVRTDRHATAEGLQSIIVSSVHSLYGDVGLPGEVDVLQVLKDKTAVLRVPFHKQVRVSAGSPLAHVCFHARQSTTSRLAARSRMKSATSPRCIAIPLLAVQHAWQLLKSGQGGRC